MEVGFMMDMYRFYTGQTFDAYQWLGAHVVESGVVFRTFAPSAGKVELLWNDHVIPMMSVCNGQFCQRRGLI